MKFIKYRAVFQEPDETRLNMSPYKITHLEDGQTARAFVEAEDKKFRALMSNYRGTEASEIVSTSLDAQNYIKGAVEGLTEQMKRAKATIKQLETFIAK